MALKLASRKNVSKQRMTNSDLLEYARRNRQLGIFNDVFIASGKARIPANSMVLSCYCTFFEKLFKAKVVKTIGSSVEIDIFNEQSLQLLIDYIYTGVISINDENVLDILPVARYLELNDVMIFCFQFLESVLSVQNCFLILSAANFYGRDSLKKHMYHFVSKNLDTVMNTKDFKDLPPKELIACITNLDRSLAKNISLYKAVIIWTKENSANRKKYFLKLLQFVNFDQIPTDFLVNTACQEKLISQDLEALNLVMSTLSLRCKKEDLFSGSKLLSIGGKGSQTKVMDIDVSLNQPRACYPDLPISGYGLCSVKLNDCIFSMGGMYENPSNSARNQVLNSVWKINLKRPASQWIKVTPMKVNRLAMGAAVFNQAVVVAGGSDDGVRDLSSTEVYIPAIDEWKMIYPMNEKRSGNVLITCRGCLYSLGGWDGRKFLSSVERLNELGQPWRYAEPMKMSRNWFAAVSFDGRIYAIGGNTSSGSEARTKSVEVYDPDTERWSFVSDMRIERSAHAAAVVDGKIFVVGGVDAKHNPISEIECYDPSRNIWDFTGNTPSKLLHHSLLAI